MPMCARTQFSEPYQRLHLIVVWIYAPKTQTHRTGFPVEVWMLAWNFVFSLQWTGVPSMEFCLLSK